MDWIRILLTVVGIYLIFLVFTKVTKLFFKIAIVALIIFVLVYGQLNYDSIFASPEVIPDEGISLEDYSEMETDEGILAEEPEGIEDVELALEAA